ncbi:hypothetical protein B566_EDAN018341 [Ephemera danica]|nr:hypothetical protein B566_EDAN018341 [Ephemera danica]
MSAQLSQNLLLTIALAPLAGAIVAGFFGRQVGRAGAHWVTILGVLVSFIGSVMVLNDVMAGARFNATLYEWMTVGKLKMEVGFQIDSLSAMMMCVVTFVSLMALLFLAAGSVIIGMHHDQDIRNMGGLRKYMPITWITSLLGSLALIGTPLFSGFYSKDSIIEAVHFSTLPGAGFAYFAVVAGVFITAFYSFRMYFLVFHGKERFHHKPFPGEHDHHDDHDAHGKGHHDATPHESPAVVWLPLVLLAIPSVVIGYLTIGPMLHGSFFKDAIFVDAARHPAMAEIGKLFHGAGAMALHALSTLPLWLALAGVVLSYVFYIVKPEIPAAIKARSGPVYTLLENKYYMDWINENILAAFARALGTGLWKGGDQGLIDGVLINGSARGVGALAGVVRRLQTGLLHWYALVMALGVFALLTWRLWPYVWPALGLGG